MASQPGSVAAAAAAGGPRCDDEGAAQRAAEQARLRKERREAKIKAGGSARLKKITGMGGRVFGDSAERAVPSPPRVVDPAPAADPDEVDISQHFRGPPRPTPPGPMSDAQLRQMMLGLDGPGAGSGPGSVFPSGPGADDQLAKLVAQFMGGSAPGADSSSALPGMTSLARQKQQKQRQQQQAAHPDAYASLFRLLHALLALGLGLYVALLTPFCGTKVEREAASLAHAQGLLSEDADERCRRVFFWIFATGEALLLSSRLLLDKRRPPPAGILWTVVGLLPEPLRGYVSVGLRYGQIFATVRADILACIFVLGVVSWCKS